MRYCSWASYSPDVDNWAISVQNNEFHAEDTKYTKMYVMKCIFTMENVFKKAKYFVNIKYSLFSVFRSILKNIYYILFKVCLQIRS